MIVVINCNTVIALGQYQLQITPNHNSPNETFPVNSEDFVNDFPNILIKQIKIFSNVICCNLWNKNRYNN